MTYDIDWPETTKEGRPYQRSQRNIKAFLDTAGIELRRNAFALRDEVTRNGRSMPLDDAVLREIRLEADDRGLAPRRDYFDDVIADLARKNSYHPVLNYIEHLEWDQKPRIDKLLTLYAGAPDTALIRAQSRAMCIAAVRRVRVPGSKFDNCVVLEGPQGVGKSTFVKELTGEPWFSDSLQIGSDPKGTIEQTAGKWICELAELAGLRRSEQQTVKAFLSRSTDRAALKYQRLATDVPRQFICIATVNDMKYLSDPTGNRRFWCIPVGRVDIPSLRRDRDQIWAEAAHYEAEGEPTDLKSELWKAASKEQQQRCIDDPWFERLSPFLAEEYGAVAKEDLWHFLKIEPNRQDPHFGQRLTNAMQRLGFTSTRLRGHSKHADKAVYCFVRHGWTGSVMPWLLNPEEPVRGSSQSWSGADQMGASAW